MISLVNYQNTHLTFGHWPNGPNTVYNEMLSTGTSQTRQKHTCPYVVEPPSPSPAPPPPLVVVSSFESEMGAVGAVTGGGADNDGVPAVEQRMEQRAPEGGAVGPSGWGLVGVVLAGDHTRSQFRST